jgi:hypothetical protein
MTVKRKFAMLAVAGAMLALVAPVSALGALTPAGYKFEIVGNTSSPPRLETSLGSCALSKITGQAPNSGYQYGPVSFTVGSCSSGTSLTFSGQWNIFPTAAPVVHLQSQGNSENITMRFASLPGCKLTNSKSVGMLNGIWSNGLPSPTNMKSTYTPVSSQVLTWADDGASCAVSGTTEVVSFTSSSGTTVTGPTPSTIHALTRPTTPIVATP